MVVGRRFGDLGTSSAFPRVPMPCSAGGAARSHGMCAAASPALRPSARAVVAQVGVSMGALTGAHTLAICGGLSCLLVSCTCFHIPASHALLQAATTQLALAALNCRPLCKCAGTDDATNAMPPMPCCVLLRVQDPSKHAHTHACTHACPPRHAPPIQGMHSSMQAACTHTTPCHARPSTTHQLRACRHLCAKQVAGADVHKAILGVDARALRPLATACVCVGRACARACMRACVCLHPHAASKATANDAAALLPCHPIPHCPWHAPGLEAHPPASG